LTCGAVFPSSAAKAHAFDVGADGYAQFVEGAAVALEDPAVLTACLAVGLAAGVWRADGWPKAWPFFAAGLVGGALVAPVAPVWTVALCTGFAALLGALTALLAQRSGTFVPPAATVGGALAMAVSLEGHASGTLGWPILAGVLLTPNLIAAATAGLAMVSLRRWPRPWMVIGWRIAASWLAAIAAMYLAFLVSRT